MRFILLPSITQVEFKLTCDTRCLTKFGDFMTINMENVIFYFVNGYYYCIIQECIPVGCVPSAAVAMCIPACTGQGGVYSSMHWAGRGVCIPACTGGGGGSAIGVFQEEGVCLGGVCLGECLPRGCPSMHWRRYPPADRMTGRCKNITLPQLRCGG